ncbi:hypothetical protein ABW19_dt0202815 [Dactylella cylindrospora]|nr:hypothetical protein ABW19_dt0202815 [Dactylella cylindrospora]
MISTPNHSMASRDTPNLCSVFQLLSPISSKRYIPNSYILLQKSRQLVMSMQPGIDPVDANLHSPSFHLGLWIVRAIRRRIYNFRLTRNMRLEGPDIQVDLSISRPEPEGASRHAERPWVREIQRALNRIGEKDYRHFMVHRAYGYHGMVFPTDSQEDYRHAYEVGKLERQWEDSMAVESGAGILDGTADVGKRGREELMNLAKVFGTTEDFDASSSDDASEYVAFR